jgi:integrase
VTGKGGQRRTVLLDEPRLVAELRRYLKATGYTHGPIFRAEKNGVGGPLRYSTVQEHWARYTAAAGVSATLHQLRHSHATELVNGGVSLPTIRKASDTRTSRPPFATPNNPTPQPTPNSEPGDERAHDGFPEPDNWLLAAV